MGCEGFFHNWIGSTAKRNDSSDNSPIAAAAYIASLEEADYSTAKKLRVMIPSIVEQPEAQMIRTLVDSPMLLIYMGKAISDETEASSLLFMIQLKGQEVNGHGLITWPYCWEQALW